MVTRRFISTKRDALIKRENLAYTRIDTYTANDLVKPDRLVYGTDTRIPTVGRQKTRQGCDFYSVPAGETVNAIQTSVTGASNQSVGLTTWKAAKFTTSAAGRLTKVELNLKNASSATGPIIVQVHADSSGSPGTLLAQSSVPASTPTSSYAYCAARFIEAPLLANATAYWIVAYIQDDGSGSYSWSSTTNATTAKTSANSGVSWSSSSFDLNFKTDLSTDSPVLGYYRAIKSDGTKVSLIAYKEAAGTTAVASVNEVTGALTTIKTGLSSQATRYEFVMFNDVVYYVNGVDAPRKWDFTTESAMGGSPGVSYDIFTAHTRLWLLPTSDKTKIIFSNIAAPETFTSTDFVYVPSPKSPDQIVKAFLLNRNIYILTRKTKWVLSGTDLSVMVLGLSTGAKGCTSPRSVSVDGNYAYFASDDGDYQFNGGTDILLSEAITNDYLDAANKDELAGVVYNNRRYLFYTPSGEATNSRCWVYNLNLRGYESFDMSTHINLAVVWNGPGDDGRMVQCSSLVGAIYYAELPSNTYNNLGKSLAWQIRMKYEHYDSPATEKQVKRWYPRFTASSTAHSVLCQYDKDFRGSPTTQTVALQGSGPIWGSSTMIWGSFTWGTSALINPRLTIPGAAKYVQLRYSRTGVNNPCEFLGHTTYFGIRRPR